MTTIRFPLRAVGAPLLAAALLALAAPALRAQAPASPVGLWKNIDDETKQPKAMIRITEKDGVISGKIEKILTDKTDAVCDKCTDDRKDQPVQGMTIVSGIRKNADQPDLFDGGSILDPNNGKVYRSQMRLTEGGKKLEVRGYIGLPLLGRTQTWLREE
ncbi:MAG TPA: DUF2147 domain-containing protein [Burkholderiaceae bacterium]|jgi:uncharacterized protein (DUF2147 family)|nr:DUF2147 domain-containing protein [Burkholderiaceae bacterium]HRA78669.1 DUF2147 domain-containing protein [Burkholderiaceae bacterium]